MRVICCCLLLLNLTACPASNPTLPDLTSGVQVVEVPKPPVVQRCVRMEDIPVPPALATVPKSADVEQAAAAAKLQRRDMDRYIGQLRAALVACATSEIAQP